MSNKVKIKFAVITPCEKEYEIVDQELWDFGKDRFTEIAKSDDCQEIFSDERIYGLKPIENSLGEIESDNNEKKPSRRKRGFQIREAELSSLEVKEGSDKVDVTIEENTNTGNVIV